MNSLRLIAGCLMLVLAGCQSGMTNPALQTLQTAIWGAEQPSGVGLDPGFAYLRVTAGKKVAFLALGYVDPHPHGHIEVWYSADREVIRLQNGRLVGVAGTLTEWRQVRLPVLPSWRELARQSQPYAWQRIRDVMPGYQFNVVDPLQLRVITPPSQSALRVIPPATLTWFEESREPDSSAQAVANVLRPARYAVEFSGDSERVVYAEQCLNADFCVTWQRWVAGQ